MATFSEVDKVTDHLWIYAEFALGELVQWMIRYLIPVKYRTRQQRGVRVSRNEELLKKEERDPSPSCLLLSLGQDKLFQWHSVLNSCHTLQQHTHIGTHLEHPEKVFFSARKSPKEGERVARRHFHERVGESPRREKNFGTSGYKIRRFVSEIWPFEVGIAVRPNSTCKI